MNILTFPSDQELNEAGAGIVTGLVQTNPGAVLGLATGSTPIGVYSEMIKSFRKGMVSYRRVSTFNLDEYAGLPREHPQSYYSYMRTHLFDHIDVPESNIHIPDGTAANVREECERYDRLLEQTGQIDLQILGLGHNGHIGFNEPDHALIRGTHAVRLSETTRQANARFFNSIDEVPTHAITMGVGTILKAKTILLIVKGSDKAGIVHTSLTGPITTECPASLLQTHPHLVVLLDTEAGRFFG
ncbi:glucosamine-6-phosphate deaminase [Paenibacillus alkalitolerans]|uniref:glucosamine-6-phosphate deaminase n=1 Tax=Paenibacillus alkalitolerans TaxID=2799335 RepID=UPI0018F5A4F9|nr:glucosamine-6-phosphate deaminase [Paenibacillus alkalitolerans]